MDRRSLSQERYVRGIEREEKKALGVWEGSSGSLVCAILIEFFSMYDEIHSPDADRRRVARSRSLVRSTALCVRVDFFKPAPRIAPLLRRCVNRITASIQRAIAWCSDSRAAVSTECNSRKTMHRVKMARIDNPMPSWSIPYMHNTHTRARRIDIRARLLLLLRADGGKE